MTHPLIQSIQTRRTTQLFDATRPIDDSQIEALVSVATTAPTSFNLQNWRFIAVRTQPEKERLRALAWDQVKVTEAAVTFIVCGQLADAGVMAARLAPSVEQGFMPAAMAAGWEGAARSLYADQPQRQRDEAVRSATFGAGTLIQAAHALGLGSAPMIGFDAEAVAGAFDLAADEIPVLLLAVGHPAPGNWPQKPRRPLTDVLTLR